MKILLFLLFIAGCTTAPKQDYDLCSTDKTLVEAFEGLASYDKGYVREGLMVPFKAKHPEIEYVMFAHDDVPRAVECAKKAKGKLILVGHSYGGHAVQDVLDSGIKPASVLTIDPRLRLYTGRFLKPEGVSWVNFYEVINIGVTGYQIDGAVNTKLTAWHIDMPYQPEVFKALEGML